MTSALYEPLIERELEAIPAAARAFADAHSLDELFLAVARFAVLAYAPSMHAKRAVMACRAAHEVREACGDRWFDLLVECARYTAESRQPWSEPPILDQPEPDTQQSLRAAIDAADRFAAERWLAAHVDDPDLRPQIEPLAGDDALLLTDAAFALLPILGEKGRYALLRTVMWELTSAPQVRSPAESVNMLIDRVIQTRGSIEAVPPVLLHAPRGTPAAPPIYHLARDYAQTLLAHAFPPRERRDEFLAAVRDNLANGEDFSGWSFA